MTPATTRRTEHPDSAEQAERLALGAEVTRQRTTAMMSDTAVADSAGLPLAVLRRYEQGAGPVDLRELRAIAGAIGTTAGALIDGAAASLHRGRFVLLPTKVAGTEHSATVWRLVEYLPRTLGRRWEKPHAVDPDRTVSRPVLDWASGLLQVPSTALGSATELTGQRSWYLGPTGRAGSRPT